MNLEKYKKNFKALYSCDLEEVEDLKPCPFCRGEAKINLIVNTFYQYARYFSSCTRCSAESKVFETEQEAIEAWNTRAYEEDNDAKH